MITYDEIALLECYIHYVTNKNVRINTNQFNEPKNIDLFKKALERAKYWMQEFNVSITPKGQTFYYTSNF